MEELGNQGYDTQNALAVGNIAADLEGQGRKTFIGPKGGARTPEDAIANFIKKGKGSLGSMHIGGKAVDLRGAPLGEKENPPGYNKALGKAAGKQGFIQPLPDDPSHIEVDQGRAGGKWDGAAIKAYMREQGIDPAELRKLKNTQPDLPSARRAWTATQKRLSTTVDNVRKKQASSMAADYVAKDPPTAPMGPENAVSVKDVLGNLKKLQALGFDIQ